MLLKSSWSGVLLFIAIFLLLFGFILSQIQVDNPLSGQESSILGWVGDVLAETLTPDWWPF